MHPDASTFRTFHLRDATLLFPDKQPSAATHEADLNQREGSAAQSLPPLTSSSVGLTACNRQILKTANGNMDVPNYLDG
jgi:hypothetical protein